MKILILALWLALIPTAYPQGQVFGQRGVSVESRAATTTDRIREGARSVTFLFSSDYTGTIKGIAFAGTRDVQITLEAPDGDTLGDIAYTVTAGTLRIIQIR